MLILFLLLGRWPFCPSSQQVRGMKLQWTNFWPFAEKSWTICQETLDHMPRNPGPSAENANKSSAICQDCQGPSAENANKSSAICQDCQGPSAENANKSSAICRDCQGLPLKYACQEFRVFLGWPWLLAHSAA